MSKRMTILVAIVALMVAMFATAAYAATINGTNNNDELFETSANDQMYGFRGADYIDSRDFDADTDKLYGGRGNDELDADDNDGRDLVVGGMGQDDSCEGDVGDAFKGCDGNVFRNP